MGKMISTSNFFIHDYGTHFTVGGIPQGRDTYTVSVAKVPLLSGEKRSQLEWESMSRDSSIGDPLEQRFAPASLRTMHALFQAVYDNHRNQGKEANQQIERFGEWAQETLRQGPFMTLSSVLYACGGTKKQNFDGRESDLFIPGEGVNESEQRLMLSGWGSPKRPTQIVYNLSLGSTLLGPDFMFHWLGRKERGYVKTLDDLSESPLQTALQSSPSPPERYAVTYGPLAEHPIDLAADPAVPLPALGFRIEAKQTPIEIDASLPRRQKSSAHSSGQARSLEEEPMLVAVAAGHTDRVKEDSGC